MKLTKYIIVLAASTFMVACGTQKNVVSTGTVVQQTTSDNSSDTKLGYIRKIYDNTTYSNNIVSKIDFTLNAMGKSVSVDGKIYMRKDDVIRITLSPLGLIEVGRVEFTPDYVLVVDRIHKQYVKAAYTDVAFLKSNGLTFYSLQSLFWNELFLPGTQKLTESDLSKFSTELGSSKQRKVTAQSSNLKIEWTTTTATGQIDAATVKYGTGTANASTASWNYTDFAVLGSRQFPATQTLTFSSKAVKSNATQKAVIKMNKLTTDSKFDSRTKVSDSYKQVTFEEALSTLVQF